MFIDSHAHYSHGKFDGEFPALTFDGVHYGSRTLDREQLLEMLWAGGLACSVEPAIELDSNRVLLDFARKYPGKIFPAVGLHPSRTPNTPWNRRRELDHYAAEPGVVAIGELGLDYHTPRQDQHRLNQMRWFIYQLKLAKRTGLPLILHIREAHRDGIRILRHFGRGVSGGVLHCFSGTWDEAQEYLKLGLHLGIGGALLQDKERTPAIQEAVRNTPLERIILETDSPYVLPECRQDLPAKADRKGLRNSSLIIPAVADKVAELKGLDRETVLRVTMENAVRLFDLKG